MNINHKGPNISARFNAERAAKIAAGLEWKGATFQIDPDSQRLIAGRTVKILKRQLLGETIDPFYWRTKDDAFYQFTVDEFLAFADEVDAYVEKVMAESWAGKDAAKKA